VVNWEGENNVRLVMVEWRFRTPAIKEKKHHKKKREEETDLLSFSNNLMGGFWAGDRRIELIRVCSKKKKLLSCFGGGGRTSGKRGYNFYRRGANLLANNAVTVGNCARSPTKGCK